MRRARRRLAGAGFALLVAAIAVWSLFPLYWAAVSSLRPPGRLFEIRFVPERLTLESYVGVFAEQPFGQSIVNSIVVAGLTTVLALGLAALAAYGFGRVAFRGRAALLLVILAASMLPQVAVLSGMFELIRWLGLYDSLAGLVVAYLSLMLPFAAWMLATAMRQLPRELEEAAAIDGAGPLTTLFRVLLPPLAPAVAATGLLAFIIAWNEFLFALTFTLSPDSRTVPVAIALISGASQHEIPWGRIMAASVVVTLPLIALTVALQRRIVAGLTAGAVQGS